MTEIETCRLGSRSSHGQPGLDIGFVFDLYVHFMFKARKRDTMDWKTAIDVNREVLLRLLLGLFATAGIAPGESVARLPRRVRIAVLTVLRPLSSAVRRLIVVAAREMAIAPQPKRAAPSGPIPHGTGHRVPSFPLFDQRKTFAPRGNRHAKASGPQIRFFDEAQDFAEDKAPSPDDMLDSARLCGRLESVLYALNTLPKQAKRLARWRMRNPSARRGPMRPGWPPGYRQRGRHEVDETLAECHRLARWTVDPPDTS